MFLQLNYFLQVFQLYCYNPMCSSKTILNIVNASRKDALNITGLSIETSTKLYNDGLVDYMPDIFRLTLDDILSLDGFSKVSANKLLRQIQSAKTPTLSKFILACGIPLVGKSTSDLIAQRLLSYNMLKKDLELGCPIISTIPGIGSGIVNSLITYQKAVYSLYDSGVRPKEVIPVKVRENVLTFVITGTLPEKRSYYENMIKQSGHKVSGSVSANTDYLLMGKDAGSKADKAKQFGTKVITTIEELEDILNS